MKNENTTSEDKNQYDHNIWISSIFWLNYYNARIKTQTSRMYVKPIGGYKFTFKNVNVNYTLLVHVYIVYPTYANFKCSTLYPHGSCLRIIYFTYVITTVLDFVERYGIMDVRTFICLVICSYPTTIKITDRTQ